MSKVSLLGVLGADAKVKQLNEERTVVNFSLCENIPVKNEDGSTVYQPQWYNVSYFTRSDRMAKYLLKGKKVYVTGTLRFSEFKNKQTGAVIKTNEITADSIEPVDWKTDVDATNQGTGETATHSDMGTNMGGLPF
jgi:single-strand DNA-binding protein